MYESDLKQHKKEQNNLKMMIWDEYVGHDFIITKTTGYPKIAKTIENRMRRILKLPEIDRTLLPTH
jgi:hypothetical protein